LFDIIYAKQIFKNILFTMHFSAVKIRYLFTYQLRRTRILYDLLPLTTTRMVLSVYLTYCEQDCFKSNEPI